MSSSKKTINLALLMSKWGPYRFGILAAALAGAQLAHAQSQTAAVPTAGILECSGTVLWTAGG
jgi:hypothetical protein